jgi:hypothetical protein
MDALYIPSLLAAYARMPRGFENGDERIMKAMMLKMLTLFVVLVLCTGAALAAGVRLHNKDAVSYRLYVKNRGSGVHTSIASNTVRRICSSDCVIKIKSTGATFNAKGGDKLIIKNGRIVRSR